MAPKNILIMVTGSVAAIKLPNLIRRLQDDSDNKYRIKVALSENSMHFFSLEEVENLLPQIEINKKDKTETYNCPSDKSFCYKSPFDKNYAEEIESPTEEETEHKPEMIIEQKTIYRDFDEWSSWRIMGDPVLHIYLRNWADIGLIAPLDANTLGKLSSGICDNLISCIVRGWDMKRPLIFAPAMNVNMWTHPLTEQSLKVVEQLGYIRVGPISKKLACGDIGMGAMAEVEQIVDEVNKVILNCTNLSDS